LTDKQQYFKITIFGYRKNKKIIIEFTNAINNRSLTAIDKLVAKNIIEHIPGAG
jgi:hypothetical protein